MRFFCVIACFSIVIVYSICSTIIRSQNPKPSFSEEAIPVDSKVVHMDRTRSMKIRTFLWKNLNYVSIMFVLYLQLTNKYIDLKKHGSYYENW